MKFRTLLAVSVLAFSFAACSDDDHNATPQPAGTGEVDVKINTLFDSAPLALNTTYTTAGGERVSFDQWRYWVSNVELTKKDGGSYQVPNSYYLLQNMSADEAVQTFTIKASKRDEVTLPNIPAGEYTGIKFSLGVDQRYNDNLTLTAGELSSMQNMTNVAWMWNTSYVFTKLKGTLTPAGGSASPLAIETGTNANYRTITLPFAAALTVGSGYHSEVTLTNDVAKVLNGVVIARDGSATSKDGVTSYAINGTTGAAMTTVANNYAQSFAVSGIDSHKD